MPGGASPCHTSDSNSAPGTRRLAPLCSRNRTRASEAGSAPSCVRLHPPRCMGPAAIVWGDRDPVLGRAIRRVTQLLPQAQVTRAQAGHVVQEEVPDLVAAAIRDVAGRIGAAA